MKRNTSREQWASVMSLIDEPADTKLSDEQLVDKLVLSGHREWRTWHIRALRVEAEREVAR